MNMLFFYGELLFMRFIMKNKHKTRIGLVIAALFLLTGEIFSSSAGAPLADGAPQPTPEIIFGDNLSDESVPRLKPAVTPYSFLWISDTQENAFRKGQYEAMGNWFSAQIDSGNAVFFFGTGDYVGNGRYESEWQEFDSMYRQIKDKIPSLLIAGNHDTTHVGEMEQKAGKTGYDHFLQHVYGTAGSPDETLYQKGRGAYRLFRAGNTDWIAVGMSYGYQKNEWEWMDGILKQYPDRKAILVLHDYVFSRGKRISTGDRIFENVVKTNENVRLILCGHSHGMTTRTDYPDGGNGRYVQTILCNYQDRPFLRGVPVRLTLNEEKGTVEIFAQPMREKSDPVVAEIPIDLR